MPRAERSHVRLELEVLPNDTYDESKEAYIPAISIYLNGDIPFNSLNESTINNILEKMRASLYKQLKDGVSNELMLRAVRRFTPKRQWRRLYSEYNLTLPVELEKEVIEEEEKANRKYTVRAEGGWEIDGPIFDEADEIHIIPAEPQRPDHRVVPDQPQVRVEPYRRGAAIRPRAPAPQANPAAEVANNMADWDALVIRAMEYRVVENAADQQEEQQNNEDQ